MDFAHDYMRALLAKEIDVAAELQKQRSQVVYQQYCAGGTMHRGYYCPSLTEDLWLGNTKRGRPPLQEAAAGGKTFSYIRL